MKSRPQKKQIDWSKVKVTPCPTRKPKRQAMVSLEGLDYIVDGDLKKEYHAVFRLKVKLNPRLLKRVMDGKELDIKYLQKVIDTRA